MIRQGYDPAGTYYRHDEFEGKIPLLLIHGVGLDHRIWDYNLEFFRSIAPVIVYDLYSHGVSYNPSTVNSLNTFTDQLEALTGELGISRFHLLGFSLGAGIAQAYAAKHANQLQSLVLLHTIYRRSPAEQQAVHERYLVAKSQGVKANMERSIQRWFSLSNQNRLAAQMELLRQIASDCEPAGYIEAYRHFSILDEELIGIDRSQINCPTLIMTSAEDSGSTPAMSRLLAEKIPHSRLSILKKGRHLAMWDQQEEFQQQLNHFYRDLEINAGI